MEAEQGVRAGLPIVDRDSRTASSSVAAGLPPSGTWLHVDRALACVEADRWLSEHGAAPGRSARELLDPFVSASVLVPLVERAFEGTASEVRVAGEGLVQCVAVAAYPAPGREAVLLTLRDATPLLQLEHEREAAVELVRALRLPLDLRHLMREITTLMQHLTGCEAVGIRLADGDDFPYYETKGFPEDFVLLESSLCQRDAQGAVCRDASGAALLDCMCGNVLRGRVDPGQPFFTEQGAFFSNGTTRLLATTSAQERQAETRNRCNGAGYESVALFPLRHGAEVFGLLQFNDRRENRFTPSILALLTRLADGLATGLLERRTAALLQRSLREKEVLLQEVHHRVKNNLQAVCSLLRLQTRRLDDPKLLEVLSTYQLRIQAIADVHELLCQSRDLARVDLAEYATKLTDYLAALHATDAGRIALRRSFEPFLLDIDDAISVGLILCELVTNAFRHAFPGTRRGTIWVTTVAAPDGGLEVEVSDDGVGLPAASAGGQGSSFGLEIVALLARQLHAELSLEGVGGARFALRIPAGRWQAALPS